MVLRSRWRRAWPPVALAVAVIVNLAWLETLGVRAREGALGSSSSPNNSLLGLFVLAGVDQCVAIEDPSTDGRAACPFLRGVQVHSGASPARLAVTYRAMANRHRRLRSRF